MAVAINPQFQQWNYTNISTGTTTLVKTGQGCLHSIVVNATAAGTVEIDDALTHTTPIIGTLKSSIAEGTYYFDTQFTVGLSITTGAASNITVVWA